MRRVTSGKQFGGSLTVPGKKGRGRNVPETDEQGLLAHDRTRRRPRKLEPLWFPGGSRSPEEGEAVTEKDRVGTWTSAATSIYLEWKVVQRWRVFETCSSVAKCVRAVRTSRQDIVRMLGRRLFLVTELLSVSRACNVPGLSPTSACQVQLTCTVGWCR